MGVNRIKLVDPNSFDGQYIGVSSDNLYNMSVPTEDLCISVDLMTTTKNRTIFTSDNKNGSQMVTVNNGGSTNGNSTISLVNFMSGKNDSTTGNKPSLTTSYTDISDFDIAENSVDEALGITSIDIEFNSSYAPMVHINFIDVKGGAIFQNGAKSKYGVLFKLPYPIFELKIKGYYGKPVIYCLHMLKCTPKFNSQTGNFEIAAEFVGYTYAMLSDMIIGYLRGAEETPRGQELVKQYDVMSITKFIQTVGSFDNVIKDYLNPKNNPDVDNYGKISKLNETLNSMTAIIKNSISLFDKSMNPPLAGDSKDPNIVITMEEGTVAAPLTNSTQKEQSTIFNKKYTTTTIAGSNISDTDKIVTDFLVKINDAKKSFNTNASNLGISFNDVNTLYQFKEKLSVIRDNNQTQFNKDVSSFFNTNNQEEIKKIVDRIKNATGNLTGDITIVIIDFTPFVESIKIVSDKLTLKEAELGLKMADGIQNKISVNLKLDTNVRNIINIFTTGIEIFLDQLVEVSSKYNDTKRLDEFKKLDKKDLDIHANDNTIYPWPEYSKNDIETYLGGPEGVENPDNVPELKFVNELFDGMKKSNEIIDDVNARLGQGYPSWYAVNPIDSSINTNGFNVSYNEHNPYERIKDADSLPDNVVRLVVLRLFSFAGFSNKYLTTKEIEAFAEKEANLVIDRFKNNNKIIPVLSNGDYSTGVAYSTSSGIINGINTSLLTVDGDYYKYNYIQTDSTNQYSRAIIPIKGIFNNATTEQFEESTNTFLSNNSFTISGGYDNNDNARYIDIIESGIYESNTVTPPSGTQSLAIKFDKIKKLLNASNDLESANFLANSGLYGVQEFTKIDYSSESKYGVSTEIPFYSLFYDDTNYSKNGISSAVTSLRSDKTPYTTSFDIGTTMLVPNMGNLKKEQNDKGNYSTSFIWDLIYLRNDVGNNIRLISEYEKTKNLKKIGFPFFNFNVKNHNTYIGNEISYNLFGSRFYNAQTLEGRAFLFLHTFPWRGLTNPDNKRGIFNSIEILNIFKNRTGFIQVPKLFTAFIGGLLWRYQQPKDPIIFGSKKNYLIQLFNLSDNNIKLPTKSQYITNIDSPASLSLTHEGTSKFIDIEKEIINLPVSVKNIFIQQFTDFVNTYANDIGNIFEINAKINGISSTKDADWVTSFNNLYNSVIIDADNNTIIKLSDIKNNFKFNPDDYYIFNIIQKDDNGFNPPTKDAFKNDFIIEYNDNSPQSQKLKELFFSYKYIANNSYLIWDEITVNNNIDPATGEVLSSSVITIDNQQVYHRPILLSTKDFATYIDKFNNTIKNYVTKTQQNTKISQTKEIQLKFELYRTLKKIYDKWINNVGLDDNNSSKVLFQCCTKTAGVGDRLETDTKIAKHRGQSTLRLIDSFRFIDRAFHDIGDEFYINPFMVNKMLLDGTDLSFYNLISRILTDNHFDFVALPSFVDYNNEDEIKNMFTPYSYYESQTNAVQGPSFVCVYVGQTSTKLDFGTDHAYPNDGFDLTNDCINCPQDIKNGSKEDWEDFGAAFVVRYGHQNQNIFKDVKLDQAEFSETAESLQITDSIANKLGNTTLSYVGQNLYNVYSVRSYKTEIEMMGNAMIQPMMYFQLENIPMFHGAYLITKVKHSIVPNHMSTVFTGVRIKKTATPLIDASALFADLLSSYNIPLSANAIALSTTGSFAPIVITIKSNGGSNGGVEMGNIKLLPIVFPNGIKNNIDKESPKLIAEAIPPLTQMLTDWVAWMKSQGFVGKKEGNTTYYAYINSAFRTYENQVQIKKEHPKYSAMPGRSNHGWGIAFDFQYFRKNGEIINNFVGGSPNVSEGFNLSINESLRWLLDNSYRYGYIIPATLRDNNGFDEFWHFEYHGKAAIGILGNKMTVYKNDFTIDKKYLDIVQNPKNPDGTVPTYTDFTYRHYGSDGTTEVYGGREIILKTFPNTNMTVIYRNAVNSVGNQLGISTGIKQLMEAQAYQEGFKDNKWYGFECSNPGALETHKELGDTPCSKNTRYAQFKDLQTGISAAYNRVYKLILDNKNANYPQGANTTLFDFIKEYAPPNENNDTEYTNMIISYFHLVFKNDTITDKTTLGEINNIK